MLLGSIDLILLHRCYSQIEDDPKFVGYRTLKILGLFKTLFRSAKLTVTLIHNAQVVAEPLIALESLILG